MVDRQISARMREVREKLNMSRPAIAEKLGCNAMTWKAYENGTSWPGGKILSGLKALGISIDWLFTGNGEMMGPPINDVGPDGPVDEALLEDVIGAVEQVLAERRATMAPAKKATLLKELYMMMLEEGLDEEARGGMVKRMIRLAS